MVYPLGAELSPAAFDEHVSVAPVLPTRRDPYGMLARRHFPATRRPCIGLSVPAVIAANPNVSGARRDGSVLHNRRRRCNPNHHIRRLNQADAGRDSESDAKNKFPHCCLRLIPCKRIAILYLTANIIGYMKTWRCGGCLLSRPDRPWRRSSSYQPCSVYPDAPFAKRGPSRSGCHWHPAAFLIPYHGLLVAHARTPSSPLQHDRLLFHGTPFYAGATQNVILFTASHELKFPHLQGRRHRRRRYPTMGCSVRGRNK
jgi:hypothetical protein